MRLSVSRKDVKVFPDTKRVIARFFFYGDERARHVIQRVMQLSEEEVFDILSPLLQEYSRRHRNITRILTRHCERVKDLFDDVGVAYDELTQYRKLLIGSYFTHEYSIESAAFFNPSIVDDPDQSVLEAGQRRVIISFRAVGEGHISSIVFRRAILDKDCNIEVLPAGDYVVEAEVVRNMVYSKKSFFDNAHDKHNAQNDEHMSQITDKIADLLGDQFEYLELKRAVNQVRDQQQDEAAKRDADQVLWLAKSYHELAFSLDTDISDRVIYPITEFESKGIEDARFVKFQEDNGESAYYATYTAYNGSNIMPKLLRTTDFYHFTVMPLYGRGAHNKNLALFPRKINGKYAMMSRIDGWSNYMMYSDNMNVWENPERMQEPKFAWEFIQIGNCGSPIETDRGWLVITHGVGPMRKYCLGASLLDLNDPSKEIGRLSEPLLIPNKDEREGYVPNVVYSCGSFIHNGKLIVPYGLSDYGSSFATVNLQELLDQLADQ